MWTAAPSVVHRRQTRRDFIITIEDTGIGISYDQKRMLSVFYMADKSRSYNEKSTGLGLSVSIKHNVEV